MVPHMYPSIVPIRDDEKARQIIRILGMGVYGQWKRHSEMMMSIPIRSGIGIIMGSLQRPTADRFRCLTARSRPLKISCG